METIDNRVRDILRVKFLTGLFDTPYQTDLALADKEVNSEAHQQVALQASREGLVLLKNANNLLPLDKSQIKRIAVCGPNADEASFALTHYGPVSGGGALHTELLRTLCFYTAASKRPVFH